MYNEHNGKFYNPLFSFHLVLVCNALREHHKNYYENKLLKFFSKVHFFLKLFSTNCFLLLLLAVERDCATDFQVNQARTDLFKIYFSSLSRSRRSNIDRKKLSSATTNSSPPTTSGGTNSGPATWSRTPPVWPALRQLGVHPITKSSI